MLVPPMLVQPFVENCIKHAFINIEYVGKIDITFKRNNDLLNIFIVDNGIGRFKSEKL